LKRPRSKARRTKKGEKPHTHVYADHISVLCSIHCS
jgi:hypothetical protein